VSAQISWRKAQKGYAKAVSNYTRLGRKSGKQAEEAEQVLAKERSCDGAPRISGKRPQ